MTAPSNGRGLPPVALQRLERAGASRVATSLLSAPGAAAARMAGLSAVGEVFGAAVVHLGWYGFGNCGYVPYGAAGYGSVRFGSIAGFQPFVTATRNGYRAALDRLAAEAAALRADGVVGIRIDVVHMGEENYEFTALGTAVRFDTPPAHPPGRLFRTELSAVDTLALVKAGWLPIDVLFGIGIEIAHDDWTQMMQTSSLGNTEVTNLTRLMSGARYQARYALHAEAQAARAEGLLLTGRQERVWEQEPNSGHRDHVAEIRLRGTGLVRFGTPTHRPAITVLPVRP